MSCNLMRIEIELYYTAFTDAQMEQLCREEETDRIEKLSAGSNELTSTATVYLQRARWDQLAHLDLRQNRIGNRGCKYLSRAHMPLLGELVLAANGIGSEGAMHLSKGSWPVLQKLFLWENMIGINGLRWMVASHWPHLQTIVLCYNSGMLVCEAAQLLLAEDKSLKVINLESLTNSISKELLKLFQLKLQDASIISKS